MDNFNLYNDIKARTDGEIYIGVVGPVRTGKSTFIRRFMDLMIIPGITDPNERERVIDELPQAGAGRTVMTTEPKFIPKDAVEVSLGNSINARFRLIDCVGYLVNGAQGIYEDEQERLVKTPWFPEEIPFTKAAEYGTGKVIRDHSTIGIVVTTDGSIGELAREGYIGAEEKTINELKRINKPFIVIVNCTDPHSERAAACVTEIAARYNVTAIPVNCERLNKDDVHQILQSILYEFPVASIEFYLPKWCELLATDNPVKSELITAAGELLNSITHIKDIKEPETGNYTYINKMKYDNFDFTDGIQRINIDVDDRYYYDNLSELTGEDIHDEYQLISMIRLLSSQKKEYGRYIDAIAAARAKGYGVVMPSREEITLSPPEVIKNGNKYGVRLKATSPSVHMIKVNIGTEISPIVGSEAQAQDLIKYIGEGSEKGEVWDTNIFGKSIGELVEDGIRGKIQMINDDCQIKLQDTMQKVVNESSGGMVCLII